jgi:hypothetical protein
MKNVFYLLFLVSVLLLLQFCSQGTTGSRGGRGASSSATPAPNGGGNANNNDGLPTGDGPSGNTNANSNTNTANNPPVVNPPGIDLSWRNEFMLRTATGKEHSCAILNDNMTYCWGSDASGKLGNGGQTGTKATPSLVSMGEIGQGYFVHITAGDEHTCALTQDYRAFCWGLGTSGQLGHDKITSSDMPVAVAGGHQFAVLEAGGNTTCGITIENKLYCWGSNSQGQLGLGDGAGNHKKVPALVAPPRTLSNIIGYRFVSVGTNHTCALSNAREVFCWGYNQHGKLGINSADARAQVPNKVAVGNAFRMVSGVVQAYTYKSVAAGLNHTCALTQEEHKIFCWGYGPHGALGTGDLTSRAAPDVTVVATDGSDIDFVRLSVGNAHSCALENQTGEAFCWGFNGNRELGTSVVATGTSGASQIHNKAHPVLGDAGYAQLSVGGSHSCTLVAGNFYCWGSNAFKQLGNSTAAAKQAAPIQVGPFDPNN